MLRTTENKWWLSERGSGKPNSCRYSENMSFLHKKNQVHIKVLLKANVFTTTHICGTLARWRVSSARPNKIFNLWICQKVVAWQWNSINISISLWTQQTFLLSFTTRHFVSSSFNSACKSGIQKLQCVTHVINEKEPCYATGKLEIRLHRL
jgi:hypothetical protein